MHFLLVLRSNVVVSNCNAFLAPFFGWSSCSKAMMLFFCMLLKMFLLLVLSLMFLLFVIFVMTPFVRGLYVMFLLLLLAI